MSLYSYSSKSYKSLQWLLVTRIHYLVLYHISAVSWSVVTAPVQCAECVVTAKVRCSGLIWLLWHKNHRSNRVHCRLFVVWTQSVENIQSESVDENNSNNEEWDTSQETVQHVFSVRSELDHLCSDQCWCHWRHWGAWLLWWHYCTWLWYAKWCDKWRQWSVFIVMRGWCNCDDRLRS